MTQPDVFDQKVLDQNIRELQEWLRRAWQQLADPSLTAFSPPRIAQPDEAMQRRFARATASRLQTNAGAARLVGQDVRQAGAADPRLEHESGNVRSGLPPRQTQGVCAEIMLKQWAEAR
ncbi:hypothetical protein ABIF24_009109 [Bradyrhizobium elkanii]|uniref:hypothetical protein n=1 Tax=Bradyrhizobium elkanii TaxID=29448 RepID=UPI0035123D1D